MALDRSGQRGWPIGPITVDYYAVLTRAIEASKANPGQLRSAIYDIARVNLHREILWQNPSISDAELKIHLLALEDAIERVEANNSEADNLVFRPDDPRHLIAALEDRPQPAPAPPEPVRIDASEIIDVQFEEVLPAQDSTAALVSALEVEPEPQPDPEPEFQAALDIEPEPAQAVDLDAQFEAVSDHEPPSASRGELVVLAPEPPMAMQSGPMLQVVPRGMPEVIVDYRPLSNEFAYQPEPPPSPPPARRVWNGVGAFVQLTAAALLAVAIFAVMTGQLNIRWLGKKPQQAEHAAPEAPKVAAAAPPVAASPAPLPFPMPATYGVYALSNDKLVELDRLAIRVPDPRVLISPEIREPSRVTLPDGKVSFVVFRRELANGAPEKVPVRVIAKIAREMTFTDGKAVTNTVDNLWRVRNNAFDFKVSPLNDNRELIVIKPDAGFVLPAGRYALVVNGQGYDFSVAGPVTSRLQCLERIETVTGAMYSECRNPQVN